LLNDLARTNYNVPKEYLMSNLLSRNEHSIDRALRIVIGLALISMIFVGPKTLWGLVGLVPLATGLVGSCPLYRLVGISTCPVPKQPKEQTQ